MSKKPRDYHFDMSRAESIGEADRSVQSFAAMPLDLSGSRDDRRYVREIAGHRLGELAEGWTWYKRLGTVRSAVERSGRIAGYAKFIAQKLGADGTVTSVIEDGRVAVAAQRFFAKNGGARGLVERFFVLMKIPAEAWLIREEDGEGYYFLSSLELDVGDLDDEGSNPNPVKWVTKPSGQGFAESPFHKPISPGNVLGRVWSPARDYFDLVNSAMPSLVTEFEVLWWLTLNMRARLQNRYVSAGMQYIPSEINEIAVTSADGKTVQVGILPYLAKAYNANIAEASRGQAGSVSRILLRGEGQHAKNFLNINDDAGIPETDMKLRAEMRDTILGSLDISKAGSTDNEEANHFTAWHNADEERRVAVQPDLEMMCWALTRLAFHEELRKDGVENPEQYRLWFDLTDAQVKANLSEDARQARDRGGISLDAMRNMSGIKGTDAMTSAEYIQWVGVLTKNARLALWGIEGADAIPAEVFLPPKQPGPPADSPADDGEAGPGAGQPGSPDDNETDTPRSQRPA